MTEVKTEDGEVEKYNPFYNEESVSTKVVLPLSILERD